MNVLLMGLRGCGKSTVGQLLAARLECPFLDLDDRVLATFDEPTVTAVWAAHGKAAWRDAEATVLGALLGHPGASGASGAVDNVIALGGGTPMVESARRDLEAARAAGSATLIYMRCTIEELRRRLSGNTGDRPSLTGADPVMELGPVLEAREPVYRQLADHEYDVTSTPPGGIAEALAELLSG